MSTRTSWTKRARAGVVVIILAAATALRLFDLGREGLWYDELYTVFAGRLPLGELVSEVSSSGHPPVYYLLVHFWTLVDWGDNVRLLSVAFGVLTVWLIYLVGRDLFSRRAGLWAAALAAVSPALVWYSRDVTMYGALTALATLSLYLLLRAIQRGGWVNWSAYALSGIALVFTYFFAAVFIIAASAVFVALVSFDRRRLWPFLACQLVLVGATVLSLPLLKPESSWVSWTAPDIDLLYKFYYGIVAAPFVLFGGWEAYVATNKSGSSSVSLSFTLILAASLLTLVGGLALGSYSRRAFFRRETLALALYLITMVCGPIVLILISGQPPAFRFYIWAAPAFLLLVGRALSSLTRPAEYLAGGILGATLLLFAIIGIQDQHYPDSRGAMELITAERQSGDEMLCVPVTPYVLAAPFYLDENMPISGGESVISYSGVVAMGEPGTTWTGYKEVFGKKIHLVGDELERRFASDLAAAERVWLVVMDATPATTYSVTQQWEELYCRDLPHIKVCLYDK